MTDSIGAIAGSSTTQYTDENMLDDTQRMTQANLEYQIYLNQTQLTEETMADGLNASNIGENQFGSGNSFFDYANNPGPKA